MAALRQPFIDVRFAPHIQSFGRSFDLPEVAVANNRSYEMRSSPTIGRSYYVGNGDRPSSSRNVLCFAVAVRICSSSSTNLPCVAASSISSSPTAVLM
jgi:hypothetical protein